MNFVKFKKLNNLSNMPATISNGCIYFVKDVGKIFVDFDSERKAYSISENDVTTMVTEQVDDSFVDLLAKLEAVEATLNPEVENNYAELLKTLKEIGNYPTTSDVQSMVAEVNKTITSSFGEVDEGVIKLDNAHRTYKINTQLRTAFTVDTSKLTGNYDVIDFDVFIENANAVKPNFLFNPTTLDIGVPLVYNTKYTLVNIRGFRVSDSIMWTITNKGSWNS